MKKKIKTKGNKETMNILTKFKSTEDGEYIIHLERMWLIANDKENDGYTPRPVPNKYFKYVYIGSIKDYLKTEFNILDISNRPVQSLILTRKHKYAIQLTYPYLGSDDNKLNKEVISLYLIDNKDEVCHCKRIWEEL